MKRQVQPIVFQDLLEDMGFSKIYATCNCLLFVWLQELLVDDMQGIARQKGYDVLHDSIH